MVGNEEMASADGLAERVDTWPRPMVWSAIAVAALLLVIADRLFPQVGMGPLYIPLIAGAGWRLGWRASCMVAVGAALLNIFPLHVQDVGLSPAVLAARGVLRLSTYAFVVAVVSGFRHAYDRQRFMARRDLMTGVVNRATFEQQTEALLASRKAPKEALLLATVDLDDFKSINDTHGHAAGDAALCAFAAAAQSLLRPEDCVGRIGGDEFALAVPVRSIKDGRAMADRLHAQLSALLLGAAYPVAISMGALIVAAEAGVDRVELMREVDRAMYQVKGGGKGGLQIRTILPIGRDGPRAHAGTAPAAA